MPLTDILASAGFSNNPFRIVPANDMDDIQWAGDDSTFQVLLEAAHSPRADELGTSELVVLFGEFGSGKTNALKYLSKRLRSEGDLVTYITKPSVADKPSWHDLVKSIFSRSFNRDDITRRLVPVRKYVLSESAKRARAELGPTADNDQDALAKCTEKHRSELISKLLPDNPGFVRFVMEMCDEARTPRQMRNWSYLSEKPSAAVAKQISEDYGLPADGMGSDYGATLILSNLIRLLTLSIPEVGPGSKVVCILMDEVEGFVELPAASRFSIQAGIRELFDQCTEQLCIALAATASDASEMWGILDSPLMQRLSRLPIQFPSPDPPEARDFMIELMAKNRIQGYLGAPEFPFSGDGLDAFVHLCPLPLTPRKLLGSAARLLQKHSDKVSDGQPIDAGDVQDFRAWAGV